MPELVIPIDPLNPGHFYACCGLVELFQHQQDWLESRFFYTARRPRHGQFELRGDRPFDLVSLISTLASASYDPIAIEGGEDTDEDASKIAAVRFSSPLATFSLDWWLNEFHTRATSLKCWGGQMTSQGIFTELAANLNSSPTPESLFSDSRPVTSRFGVDPRSSWTTIDAGYSLNEQNHSPLSFPAVELLSAFGLQRFRPGSASRDKVSYHLWGDWLHHSLAGLAANQPWDGLAAFSCQFQIMKRGQGYKYLTFATPDSNTITTGDIQ